MTDNKLILKQMSDELEIRREAELKMKELQARRDFNLTQVDLEDIASVMISPQQDDTQGRQNRDSQQI